MSFLFGGTPPTTSELARRYKMAIARAVRDIDREVMHVREQEKAGMAEIRRFAQTNPTVCMQKARGVVRARKMQARFMTMKGQLQEISSRIMHVRSSEALQRAIQAANMAIQAFTSRLGQRSVIKTVQDFTQNNARMNAQAELAEDLLGDIFDASDGDGEEENDEVDSVVLSVLNEAGVALHPPLVAAAQMRQEGAARAQAGGGAHGRTHTRDGGGGGEGGLGGGGRARGGGGGGGGEEAIAVDDNTEELERRLRRLMRMTN